MLCVGGWTGECSLKVAICAKFDALHLQFKSSNSYNLYATFICRYVHCSVHRTWWLHYFAQVALLCANVHNVAQCPRIVSDTLVAGRWVHCTGTGIASAQATRRGTDFWQGIYIMCHYTRWTETRRWTSFWRGNGGNKWRIIVCNIFILSYKIAVRHNSGVY